MEARMKTLPGHRWVISSISQWTSSAHCLRKKVTLWLSKYLQPVAHTHSSCLNRFTYSHLVYGTVSWTRTHCRQWLLMFKKKSWLEIHRWTERGLSPPIPNEWFHLDIEDTLHYLQHTPWFKSFFWNGDVFLQWLERRSHLRRGT